MDSLNGQQVSQIGFNLNITKLIVEQHVAEIEVISAVSDGMKFFSAYLKYTYDRHDGATLII